jgi:hypothetical protein
MDEEAKILGDALRSELKELMREVLREVTPKEAVALLGQSGDKGVRWLHRHARRISRKNLRFSEAGLRRWIAAKKPLSTR